MKRAQYIYEFYDTSVIVIRDVGNHNVCPTVTNGAEEVVAEILERFGGTLSGRRVYYYDSEGDLAELVVKDKRFAGFAPVSLLMKSALEKT